MYDELVVLYTNSSQLREAMTRSLVVVMQLHQQLFEHLCKKNRSAYQPHLRPTFKRETKVTY